jgi:hypothetical protein
VCLKHVVVRRALYYTELVLLPRPRVIVCIPFTHLIHYPYNGRKRRQDDPVSLPPKRPSVLRGPFESPSNLWRFISSQGTLFLHLFRIIPFHHIIQGPRRGSTTDSSLLPSPSLTPKPLHSSARPPFTSTEPDTARDASQRPNQSHSRPPSPFKSSDRSSNSPDRSHTRARVPFPPPSLLTFLTLLSIIFAKGIN